MSEQHEQPLVAMDALPVRFREGIVEFGVARRANAPHRGELAIPGVLLLPGEHGAAPVLRALRTKAQIPDARVRLLRQLGWFDGTMRDPRSATISLTSLVFLQSTDDAGALEWRAMERCGELPFDHAEIVRAAMAQLGDLVWRDWLVTRSLLGEKFATGDALALGSALDAEPYDRPNFRRWLERTGRLRVATDTTGLRVTGRTTAWEWID